MKKHIFSIIILALSFAGCSSSSEENQEKIQLPTCIDCTITVLNQFTNGEFCNNGDGSVTYTYSNRAGRSNTKIIKMSDEGVTNFKDFMLKKNETWDCPYIKANLDRLKGK